MPGPTVEMEPIEPQSVKKLSFKSLKRTSDLFSPTHAQLAPPDPESKKIRMNHKINLEYKGIKSTCEIPLQQVNSATTEASGPSNVLALPGSGDSSVSQKSGAQNALVVGPSLQPKGWSDGGISGKSTAVITASGSSERNFSTSAIMERIPSKWPRPVWRPPWKNYRVISGHLGWVRSVAFDPSNTWFCTGSADRTIKIWDVGSGRLKLTLTGHIEQVRGLAVSQRHTYMFSAGDDKQVKCWDLEQNKAIRSYHGHLSGVYCLALHPTIDLLLTGGRDSVCRVWDIRTKVQVFALSGHDNTVCSVFTRPTDPQVVTGSHDSTIKFWDLRYGKTMLTLTHHKKSVRAMALHPTEHCFASASADNIKKFNLPKGEFLHNMLSQQKTIINAMAVNEDGVMATGGDNGSLWFWDWKSGHNFQQAQTIVQPGSLDSEAGIYAVCYDVSGSRLVTCEADKTIKMWKEDEDATPETHPLNYKPPKDIRRF
ncbi:PREDICTED: protein pleiotropic regulatory locus 1-like isoform X1 [Populus euphratica]|uniref:Protein pleiotropic regulatory locus 1-like isoform X1 n=1 Tax=Populus euphratica TaxID=75702 RepID=A0AAJ6TKH7_POPEU|nr:PREDICTED: protein pleiotropic regulatory locus 1-like isoform X1 [Populus euphratica]